MLDVSVRRRIVQRFLVEKRMTLKNLRKELLNRNASNEGIKKITCDTPIDDKTEIALVGLYCETGWSEYKKKKAIKEQS